MTLSARSKLGHEENPLSIALARARAAGRSLLDLTLSNPTTAGFPYAAAELCKAFADPRLLRYEPEPLGAKAAREVLAARFARAGHAVSPDRIFLTASTSEAYSTLLKLLCDPGDQVLAPQPSYPLLDHLAQLENVALTRYRLSYDGAWHVDLDSVARAITARTRAILIVSPNNPTGSYLKREELSALAGFGLPLISDEVFARYELSSSARRAGSVLEADSCLTFALGGLSKEAGLPQLKLAWTAVGGPSEQVTAALERLEILLDAYLSPSTPVQLALAELLAAAEPTAHAIAERCRHNLQLLDRALLGSAATRLDVEGGWYAVLRLPQLLTEENWALALLEHDSVVIHPGFFYDFEREPIAVLSLITPPEAFAEGVQRLARRVAGG